MIMQTRFNEEEIELLHQMLDKFESGDISIFTRKAELLSTDFSNLGDMQDKNKRI